jgi:hypothetical protein
MINATGEVDGVLDSEVLNLLRELGSEGAVAKKEEAEIGVFFVPLGKTVQGKAMIFLGYEPSDLNEDAGLGRKSKGGPDGFALAWGPGTELQNINTVGKDSDLGFWELKALTNIIRHGLADGHIGSSAGEYSIKKGLAGGFPGLDIVVMGNNGRGAATQEAEN